MKQELGLNSFGEHVYIDDRGDLKVVDRNTGKSVFASKRKTPLVQQRAQTTPRPSVAEEVDQALKEHPGVAALVNEKTGAVAMFMPPKPYYADNKVLTETEVTALEAERTQLIDSLANLRPFERGSAATRIREIERELNRDRLNREAKRRDQERIGERRREGVSRTDIGR